MKYSDVLHKFATDSTADAFIRGLQVNNQHRPTGEELLALERRNRLQAEAHRRRARIAREKLGINDYSTLTNKLSWINTLNSLKYAGKGALAGMAAGGLTGLGYGVASRSGAVPALAGGIGGTALGAVVGLLLAGIQGTRGSLAALDAPPTRDNLRKEYADIMNRKPGDVSIYDASKFNARLHNYIADNTSRADDLKSYAF